MYHTQLVTHRYRYCDVIANLLDLTNNAFFPLTLSRKVFYDIRLF